MQTNVGGSSADATEVARIVKTPEDRSSILAIVDLQVSDLVVKKHYDPDYSDPHMYSVSVNNEVEESYVIVVLTSMDDIASTVVSSVYKKETEQVTISSEGGANENLPQTATSVSHESS